MKLRSGRIIPSGAIISPSTIPQQEKIYDYIVRRDHIINRIRVNLNLLLANNLSYNDQLELVYSTYCLFISEFEFLTKYKFEPNKRFIKSFHDVILQWIDMYPSLGSTLYGILYKCNSFNDK